MLVSDSRFRFVRSLQVLFRRLSVLGATCLALAGSTPAFGKAQPGPATLAYQERINSIITQLVVPALTSRLDQLRGAGTVKLTYRVRANGEVGWIKITSGSSNHFVNDTCKQTIKAAKLPPIPKDVLKELHRRWVEVDTEIGINH